LHAPTSSAFDPFLTTSITSWQKAHPALNISTIAAGTAPIQAVGQGEHHGGGKRRPFIAAF
jgi:hypothetical protein